MRFVVDWVLSMILFFVPLLHFFEQFLTGAFFVILIEVPFLFYFLVKLYVCFGFRRIFFRLGLYCSFGLH